MKVAIVYNRESKNVVNLFGMPNKEKIGLKTIRRLSDALKQGGHQVAAFEGDKDLVDRLEEFMPRVVAGERPGLVFNVSYGIQGQARYTHVPSILEMIGVPYVASGPLAHSLSLDKVVTKMILRQHGIPTPDFVVLDTPDAALPHDLRYPMIVKPKNEAVSFGLRIVNDEAELREGAAAIFERFRQPVLVEQYVDGREINVGLLGNDPPEALPPVELLFGSEGPAIYSYEDKTGRSGRTISHACPAPIGEELLARARELAICAFTAIGCYDCARVDMRLDRSGELYILETNSLPSLGEHGSYLIGAAHVGLDFAGVVNRLVDVAAARYFGTPEPPQIQRGAEDPASKVFTFVTQRRDEIERRLREWTNLSSHTVDPVGVQEAVRRADRVFRELGMERVDALTDERSAWTWQTHAGLEGGTLLVVHLDVPAVHDVPSQRFRREPEWLYGDGIASSRAPLTMLEFALRAVRSVRRLRQVRLGVLAYTDEGRDARYSADTIVAAAGRAARVLVLRPGASGDAVMTKRRGQRKYRFRAEAEPRRLGRSAKRPEPLRWVWNRLEEFSRLGESRGRVSVSVLELRSETLPLHVPHRVTAHIVTTFPDRATADTLEQKMRGLPPKGGPRWELERVSDRPAMRERSSTQALVRELKQTAEEWKLPLKTDSSASASVAGLVPDGTARLCGMGPAGRDLGTPHEAVQRICLVQRTLLLARYLVEHA